MTSPPGASEGEMGRGAIAGGLALALVAGAALGEDAAAPGTGPAGDPGPAADCGPAVAARVRADLDAMEPGLLRLGRQGVDLGLEEAARVGPVGVPTGIIASVQAQSVVAGIPAVDKIIHAGGLRG